MAVVLLIVFRSTEKVERTMFKITKKRGSIGPDIALQDWYDEVGRNDALKFDNEFSEDTDYDEHMEEIFTSGDLAAEVGVDQLAYELDQDPMTTYLLIDGVRLDVRFERGEVLFDGCPASHVKGLKEIADHLDAKLIDRMGKELP